MQYRLSATKVEGRIDVFIGSQLKEFSRNNIQEQIKRGNVKANGVVVKKANFIVKEGDSISINISSKVPKKLKIIPSREKIDILYNDPDCVVINKAPGISVYPGAGSQNNTVINALLNRFVGLSRLGEKFRFGLVHRLDKGTSGVLTIALNQKAHWFFSRQFEEREVSKIYIALVAGDIGKRLRGESQSQEVSNYIGRHKFKRKQMAIVDRNKGRIAVTGFHFLAAAEHPTLGILSLVLVRPKTGRTHQIRVQLAHLGFPIIGDSLYGGKSYHRLMLHAYKLGLKMTNGEKKSFTAQLPKEFIENFDGQKVLAKINSIVDAQGCETD